MVPFALVGGVFNVIELGLTWYLVEYQNAPLQLTYTFCFIVATLVAYTLNTFFTFRSKFTFINFTMYFSIYMGALLIGKIVMAILQQNLEFSDGIYPFLAAPFVYLWNFFLTNRYLER